MLKETSYVADERGRIILQLQEELNNEKGKNLILEKDVERLKMQIIEEKSRSSEILHEFSIKSTS